MSGENLAVILNIAQWAVSQTRAIIPYSANYPLISDNHHQHLMLSLVRHEPNNVFDAMLYEEIASWHLDLSSQKKHPLAYSEYYVQCLGDYIPFKILHSRVNNMPSVANKYSGLRLAEINAQRALRFGLGNCAELSSYTLLLLLECPYIGPPIRVELFSFPNKNDHVFLVLNRNQGKINDLSSWNEDAVFCDAWQTEFYTKKYLIAHRDDEALQYIHDAFRTELQKFWIFNNRQEAFVGMNSDLRFYSQAWHCPRYRQYWEPIRLLDIKDRSAFSMKERLPQTRPLSLKIKRLGPSLDDLILYNQPLGRKQEKRLRWDILLSRHYLIQKINGDTPIVRAAKRGRWDIVSIFADYPTDKKDKAEYGQALLFVIQAKQLHLAMKLIGTGAKTTWHASEIQGKNNVLHYAVDYNDRDLLKALLKTKIWPSYKQKNTSGETPIVRAARLGRWHIVSLFATCYNTNPNDDAEYGNALIYAFQANQRDIVFQLIKAKAKTDWYSNFQNGENNPLHYAIFQHDIPLLQVLLKTNIERACIQKNRNNETPLELAKRIAPNLLPIFEENGFFEKSTGQQPFHENNEDKISISEIEIEDSPSSSDKAPEIYQNKKLFNETQIEDFKKIYRALSKTQSSIFSRNFIKKFDTAADKETCIFNQIQKYPNSKSAVAWHLAGKYSGDLANLDLIRAIHKESYNHRFFKHSKNKKILHEVQSLDAFLNQMHTKSSSETIIRCLEIY